MKKKDNSVKIKTFIGLADYVDKRVNDFVKDVVIRDIQTHATGKESITVTVIYEEVE